MGAQFLKWNAAMLTTGLLATSASAAAWDSPVDGNWDNPARWDTNDVPDTASEDADFTAHGTDEHYTVTVDDAYTIGTLDLAARYAEVLISDGGFLTMQSMLFSRGGNVGMPVVRVDGGGFHVNGNISGGPRGFGRLIFDGGSTASSVDGNFRVPIGTQVELNSGTINLGGLAVEGGFNDADDTYFKVQGATVTVDGNAYLNGTSGTNNRYGALLEVSSGSFTADRGLVGSFAPDAANGDPDDRYILRVKDTGTASYSSFLGVGADRNAVGRVEIEGGSLSAGELLLGRNVRGGAAAGRGYYIQTGGTSTIGRVTLYTDDDDTTSDDNGTRQLVVTNGSMLTITGMGFTKEGTNDWLLTDEDVDLSGTIAFDPDGVATQNLLAFGEDQGASMAGLIDNFAIGTLDLTQLVAEGAELQISAADDGRVLYVDSLLGFENGDAVADHLLGDSMTVYYNENNSTGLSGDHAFGNESQLVAIPEPASFALLTLGLSLIATRRRR